MATVNILVITGLIEEQLHHKVYLVQFYRKVDGWRSCNLTVFSTVLMSYQDDGRLIRKGCVQWNPIYN